MFNLLSHDDGKHQHSKLKYNFLKKSKSITSKFESTDDLVNLEEEASIGGYKIPRILNLPHAVQSKAKSSGEPTCFTRSELGVDSVFFGQHHIAPLPTCNWLIPDLLAFGSFPLCQEMVNKWRTEDQCALSCDSYEPCTAMDRACKYIASKFDVLLNLIPDEKHTFEPKNYAEILSQYRQARPQWIAASPVTPRRTPPPELIHLKQPFKQLNQLEEDKDLKQSIAEVMDTATNKIVDMIRREKKRVLIYSQEGTCRAPIIAGIVFAKLYEIWDISDENLFTRLQATHDCRGNTHRRVINIGDWIELVLARPRDNVYRNFVDLGIKTPRASPKSLSARGPARSPADKIADFDSNSSVLQRVRSASILRLPSASKLIKLSRKRDEFTDSPRTPPDTPKYSPHSSSTYSHQSSPRSSTGDVQLDDLTIVDTDSDTDSEVEDNPDDILSPSAMIAKSKQQTRNSKRK